MSLNLRKVLVISIWTSTKYILLLPKIAGTIKNFEKGGIQINLVILKFSLRSICFFNLFDKVWITYYKDRKQKFNFLDYNLILFKTFSEYFVLKTTNMAKCLLYWKQ